MLTRSKAAVAAIALLLMLMPTVGSAATSRPLSAHIKRDKNQHIVIYGRAPAGADLKMRLEGPKGKFLSTIETGVSSKGRYRVWLEAKRPSARARVTATDGDDVYTRTTRLLPALASH